MHNFLDFSQTDWQAKLLAWQLSPTHSTSLFRHIYKGQARHPGLAANLPKKLKLRLGSDYPVIYPEAVASQGSSYDGSRKFLLKLTDGLQVESVLMPEAKRLTLCLSSQVGCRQGCTFCHTGRMGLLRNLTPGEIVGQVLVANQWIAENPTWLKNRQLPPDQKVSNLVFMGMGEPLDNVKSLSTAIDILTDPHGLGIAKRRVCISTAGHLPGLEELLAKNPKVKIALSLHAVDQRKRSQLMPINKKWPALVVLQYLAQHYCNKRDDILIQYTLISGLNDTTAEAQALVNLVKPYPVKINVIPYNEIGPARYRSPSAENLKQFCQVIHNQGIRVLVRYSKGQDIYAACGQLYDQVAQDA